MSFRRTIMRRKKKKKAIPQIQVGGRTRREIQSVWFVTINPNLVAHEHNIAEYTALMKTVKKRLLDAFYNLELYKLGPGETLPKRSVFNSRFINYKGASDDAKVETGTRPHGRRTHLHMVLSQKHFTSLQLDAAKIRKITQDVYAERNYFINPWVSIRWFPSRHHLNRYVRKGEAKTTPVDWIRDTLEAEVAAKSFVKRENLNF